jgi:tetratricopeptide (TPR) repeat protein
MMLSLAKKKILIVEDFAEFARSLRAMLHPMGATEATIVYNAQDAIEACKSTKFDIILSDYNLGPKKDGQQLLEELQHEKLIKSSCIFIMITAENTTSMVMAAVEYVPDNYIAKPFNGNLLQSRLQKAMEKKEALLELNRLMRNKQWSEALERIEEVIQQQPKFKMSCLRAKIEALKNLKQLDAGLKIAKEITSVRTIPWALEAIGELYYLKKEYQKSVDIFNQLIQEFPMSVDGYDWLAKVQRVMGMTKEAQLTLEDAVKRSPRVLQRQKMLGLIAEENHDYDTMSKAYRNAVKYGEHSSFCSADEYLQLTSAISNQIRNTTSEGEKEQQIEKSSPKVDIKKSSAEVSRIIESVTKKFPKSQSNLLRCKVAESSFLNACGKTEEADILVKQAIEIYQKLDQQLTEADSLAIAKSLTDMGQTEFAETVVKKAAEQHFEDNQFIIKAAKLCSQPEILQHCKKASRLNMLGVEYFEKKDFSNAAKTFEQVYELAPSHINMALNYIQTLLKLTQSSDDKSSILKTANRVLNSIPEVKFPDPRFERYKELKRLTLLLLESSEKNSKGA